ncbi:MAG: hypothetical protein ACP5E4_01145, partial [Candidatus Aenigmatarchaeota archaeon]
NYTQATSFSGLAFSDRFSRGGVRQGVEITPGANWTVKGFMKNIAYGQIYRLGGWSLYKVGSDTPSLSKTVSINLL